ncbi:unnamed protein product [Soboliphyme baturini]|uniref:SAM domain-containing protein n=1 Tax=Soboliphyme baturini TaxID=241478 RepID=A0A183IDJ4_9BILA|nr:unnamed protein product [Soboliphyme baturini]
MDYCRFGLPDLSSFVLFREAAPMVSSWSVNEVFRFIVRLGFPREALAFRREEVDGPALLLLKRYDVLSSLSLQLGPAINLYRRIATLQDMVRKGQCEDKLDYVCRTGCRYKLDVLRVRDALLPEKRTLDLHGRWSGQDSLHRAGVAILLSTIISPGVISIEQTPERINPGLSHECQTCDNVTYAPCFIAPRRCDVTIVTGDLNEKVGAEYSKCSGELGRHNTGNANDKGIRLLNF